MVGPVVSPFDLPEPFQLVEAYLFHVPLGPPVVKQLMQRLLRQASASSCFNACASLTLRREMEPKDLNTLGLLGRFYFWVNNPPPSVYSPPTLPAVRWLSFTAHMALWHVPGALRIDGGKVLLTGIKRINEFKTSDTVKGRE